MSENLNDVSVEKRDIPVCKVRLLSGLHGGASRNLNDGDLLLLGSDPECDLVLSDKGIHPHHLLVVNHRGQIKVKALESGVTLAGRGDLRVGQTIRLDEIGRLRIGDVRVAAGDAQDPGWGAVLKDEERPPMTPMLAPRTRLLTGGLASIAVICVTLGLSLGADAFTSNNKTVVVSDLDRTNLLVDRLQFDELTVRSGDQGIELAGIVPRRADVEALNKALERDQIQASLKIRTGEGIADDLERILRLPPFGYRVQAEYESGGGVHIFGFFDDEEELKKALKSSSVQAISGLEQVSVTNRTEVEQLKEEPAFEFRAVRGGTDPYLVMACGARFYLGAEIPGMGTLVGLEGQSITIHDGNSKNTIDLNNVRPSGEQS